MQGSDCTDMQGSDCTDISGSDRTDMQGSDRTDISGSDHTDIQGSGILPNMHVILSNIVLFGMYYWVMLYVIFGIIELNTTQHACNIE